jgi:phosphate:Na+ symporter
MQGVPALLVIVGGVALILSGARALRKGLDRIFGPRLSAWMQRMIDSRLRAFFTGLGISVLAPSSTTMSLLAVQTVQAGSLSVASTLAVMLGANIGLTVMVLLIAMRIEAYWPVLVVPGVLLYQYTQMARSRGIGQFILGLGLIFLGISAIKQAAVSAGGDDDLIKLLDIASHYPWFLMLIAAVMAIVLQSSTATIGLMIGLAGAGAIRLDLAVPVVAGVNVGTALTTLLFGWRQIDSRRLAMGNLIAKLAITVLLLLLRDGVVGAFEQVPGTLSNRIAYFNTGFNVLIAVLLLPFLPLFSRILVRIAPQPPGAAAEKFGPRYITTPVDTMAMALGQSMREIMRVAEIVRGMLADLWTSLEQDDERLSLLVAARDDEVDLLDREIKRYLTHQSRFEGDERDASEQMRQLGYLNELETIGDVIDKNLSEIVLKKIRTGIAFSPEGWRELNDVYQKVMENMLIAETAFATRDTVLAQKLLRHKEEMSRLDRELRERHFSRLTADLKRSHESSAVHLDLLTYLKRINSSVSHVAYNIIESSR